jgi:hypothetical protein
MFADDDDPATTAMFQKLIANGLIRSSDLVENGFEAAATKLMIGKPEVQLPRNSGATPTDDAPVGLASAGRKRGSRGLSEGVDADEQDNDEVPDDHDHQGVDHLGSSGLAACDEEGRPAKRLRPRDTAGEEEDQQQVEGKSNDSVITVQNEDLLVQKLRQLALGETGEGESETDGNGGAGIEVEEGGVVFLPSWAGAHRR